MKYSAQQMNEVLEDARYTDIGNLPSNFYPYGASHLEQPFTSLFIRPFTVRELRLISKAALLNEMQHLIRAVDLVITQDINEIAIGDFYYILMWLKIHSMPKSPYAMDWMCDAPVLTHKETKKIVPNDHTFEMPVDEENYTVETCQTSNTQIIYLTETLILSLDENNFEPLPTTESVEYDFPRVRSMIEYKKALEDPELNLIVGPAQWIKGSSLGEQLSVLEAQDDLSAFDMASVLNNSVVFGVKEKCVLQCRSCSKSTEHALILDPLSFFQ